MKLRFCCLFFFNTFFALSNALKPPPYTNEFATCCKEKSVSATCQEYCSFAFTPKEIIAAFSNATCKFETDFQPYYQCLQNSKNMTKCCTTYNVATENKPKQCLNLCDGSTPIKYDKNYTLCEPDQNSIMSCGIDSYNLNQSYSDKSLFVHKGGSTIYGPVTPTPLYTIYPSGYKYVIYGTIDCVFAKSVGQKARVTLMEYDPISPDDFLGSVPVIDNTFIIISPDTENDFPDANLELYLVFENVCGYWNNRQSGIVINDFNVTYQIMDDYLPKYAGVNPPFQRIAEKINEDGGRFRNCWLKINLGEHVCDFKDFMDAKRDAMKFKIGGGGPGK